jgi:hypothetical protein
MGMKRTKARVLAALWVLIGGIPALAQDAPAAKPGTEASPFLRFMESADGSARLQTSIQRYVNDDGVVVDLIGAVHIADGGYFKLLQDRFEGYDALLYEMVKPRDRAPEDRGGRSGSMRWVGTLQKLLKDQLDLEFQLEAMDYSRDNFVHADLDAETFMERQRARGESITRLMLRSMMSELRRGGAASANQPSMVELIAAFASPDKSRRLKLILARQFQDMDRMLQVMEGPEGSVILSERNEVAMKVLKEQIEQGKRNLGIFYGAGHLKGMDEILTNRLGFKRQGPPEWITAWEIPADGPSTPPSER